MKLFNIFTNEMSCDVNIPITNEIYLICKPIVIVSRIWGLFPYAVHRDGPKIMFKKSLALNIYSYSVAITLVSLIIIALIFEYQAGDKSVRTKTHLSVYVTIADVTIVVFTMFIAIIGGPLNSKIFKILVKNIVEIDKIIPSNDRERARKVSMVALGALFFGLLILLTYDFSTWMQLAIGSKDAELEVVNHIPIYLAYVIVVLLEYQFWFIIKALRRRLQVVTNLLSKDNGQRGLLFNSADNKMTNSEEQAIIKNMRSNFLSEIVDNFGTKTTKSITPNHNNLLIFDLKQSDNVENLMKVYFKISRSVDCVNKFCGVFLLVILLSCLTHLVITPYFLVMELYERHNIMYECLQVVWTIVHCLRIIGIIEPCHSFKVEETRLLLTVSKLLYFEDRGEKFRAQVKQFFNLIKTTDNQFTAFGLAKIDRSLMTTILGAVTTYLVILIQFQKTPTGVPSDTH